jgi:hypothetical protein
MEKKEYIKPSVLQLDFSTDEEVVSFSSCKTNTDSTGSGLPVTCGNFGPGGDNPCTAAGNS